MSRELQVIENENNIKCFEPCIYAEIEDLPFPIATKCLIRERCMDDLCLCADSDPLLCADDDTKVVPPDNYLCLFSDDALCADDSVFNYCADQIIKVPNCLDCIDLNKTTSTITESVRPDQGSTSFISSFSIRVVDKDCIMSQIIATGGGYIDDLMGKKVNVWLETTGDICEENFPEKWKKIFSGYVCEICSSHGYIDFKICHPETLKKQSIFTKVEVPLASDITNSQTTIPVNTNFIIDDLFLEPSDCFRTAIKIDDEIMTYTGYDPVNGLLTGVTRADPEFYRYCDNVAVAHDQDATIESIYILEGNAIEIALKLMLSCNANVQNPNTSVWNVLPDGLCMSEEDVDITRHLEMLPYVADAEMCFYLTDTIEDVKEFIDKELFTPVGLYSMPRETKSSVNVHRNPVFTDKILVVDDNKVTNCDKLKLRRSLNKHYYNQILYKHTSNPCDGNGTYLGGNITIDEDARNAFIKTSTLEICSKGLRSDKGATTRSRITARNLLKRYSKGAEHIQGIEMLFSCACDFFIGDTIRLDLRNLAVTDTSTGKRGTFDKFYEVIKKEVNYKTGKVKIDVIDVDYDSDGLKPFVIAPCIMDFTYFPSTTDTTINASDANKFCVGDCVSIQNEDCSIVIEATIIEHNESSFIIDQVLPLGLTGVTIEPCDYKKMPQEFKDRFGFIGNETDICGDQPYQYS